MEIMNVIEDSFQATIEKNYPNIDNKTKEGLFKTALTKILNDNNYNYITGAKQARGNMIAVGKDAIICNLVKGAIVSYEVEFMKNGKLEDTSMGPNNYPQTTKQAVNYIVNSALTSESASQAYQLTQRDTNLQELLVSNYAKLMTNTTREERLQAQSQYAGYFGNCMNTLTNLENYLKEGEIVKPVQY